MDLALLIVGWLLWLCVLLWGFSALLSRSPDGGVRFMMHTQGAVLLGACATTSLLPVSKFWLLLAIAIAFYLPMLLMLGRGVWMKRRFAQLVKESVRTGESLETLLAQETRRLGGSDTDEAEGEPDREVSDQEDGERLDALERMMLDGLKQARLDVLDDLKLAQEGDDEQQLTELKRQLSEIESKLKEATERERRTVRSRLPRSDDPQRSGGDMTETTLLKDRDWEQVDGRVCLVTELFPTATVKNGQVKAMNSTTPYASVRLRCETSSEELTGFITHKLDFAMLWAAFNERTQVPGTRSEVRYVDGPTRPGFCENSNLATNGGGPDEEVWLVWTRKRYKTGAGLFSAALPKLIVLVCPVGAFELLVQPLSRPELKGMARHRAIAPLLTMTPEVMEE